MGDANFGVFSVAYAAAQQGHPVVLRLTPVRAQHLAGEPLRDGMDRSLQWWPTRADRRKHPEWPSQAQVRGRLIVRQVQPSDGSPAFLLALFSSLEAAADESVHIYGRRWNIETDVRSLKGTLALEQLTCTTPEMVAKELDVAMLSYNLVRAITCLAAQAADLPPRVFSFTGVRNVVNAFAPLLAAAPDEPSRQQLWAKMMYYAGQARLPQRRRKRRSYPRAVWGRPQVSEAEDIARCPESTCNRAYCKRLPITVRQPGWNWNSAAERCTATLGFPHTLMRSCCWPTPKAAISTAASATASPIPRSNFPH